MSVRKQIVQRVLNAYRFSFSGSPAGLFQNIFFNTCSEDLDLKAAVEAVRKSDDVQHKLRLMEATLEGSFNSCKIPVGVHTKIREDLELETAVEAARMAADVDHELRLMNKKLESWNDFNKKLAVDLEKKYSDYRDKELALANFNVGCNAVVFAFAGHFFFYYYIYPFI